MPLLVTMFILSLLYFLSLLLYETLRRRLGGRIAGRLPPVRTGTRGILQSIGGLTIAGGVLAAIVLPAFYTNVCSRAGGTETCKPSISHFTAWRIGLPLAAGVFGVLLIVRAERRFREGQTPSPTSPERLGR